MRRGSLLVLVGAVLASGCGSTETATPTTTHAAATTRASTKATGALLRVGVVGPLRVDAPGVRLDRGRLAAVAGAPLVLADARVVRAAALAASARAHPVSHFALIGASAAGNRAPNLVGVVLAEEDAAFIGGIVAGLAAGDQGGAAPRVAWVGPEERRLAAAFGRGVHQALPEAEVLHQWTRAIAARCKEASLIALDRGASVVMANAGVCADAAVAAAHQQNLPGLELGDFLLPGVAAGLVARDAAAGVFHGGDDLVFGPETGAVGIARLDPRISPAAAARARGSAQELANGVASAG
jgi:hypothetical protein